MIYVLNATGRLTKYEEKIRSIITEAVSLYSTIHSFSDIDIVVAENPSMTVPEHGVGGYTATAHEVYISLDINRDDIETMISEHLGPTIAHELTHIIRLQIGKKLAVEGTLADNVIGEGLSDTVSMSLYPDQNTPWIKNLTDEQFVEMKKVFIAQHDNTYYDHNAWFYGNKEAGIYRWTGYSLGYALIKDYLNEHPSLTIKDLVPLDTKELMSVWL